MEEKKTVDKKIERKKSMWCKLRRVPIKISQTSEHLFYKLGLRIAQRPYSWLAGSAIVVLLCLGGLLRFRQEKNPLKLWVPPDSDFVRDTEWLMENFGEGMRVQTLMMTGENVLEPRSLLKLNEATDRILRARSSTGLNTTWTDVCFKVPVVPGRRRRDLNSKDSSVYDQPEESEIEGSLDIVSWAPTGLYCSIYNSLARSCYSRSILDIWRYDSDVIGNLTIEDVLNSINTVTISPTLGQEVNYTQLLGDVVRDSDGRIIAAKAVKSQWFLHVNFSEIDMNEIGNDVGTADWATEDVLEWEREFIKAAQYSADQLAKDEARDRGDLAFRFEAGRSFGDVSASTMFQDISKLVIGMLMMSVYVQIILSRFNWVEWRSATSQLSEIQGGGFRHKLEIPWTNPGMNFKSIGPGVWKRLAMLEFCLTTAGLMCVGGAFIIAVGICSLIGVPYGPVHTSLPFMLMGLGVDDIFVMMASWDQVHSVEENHRRPVTERIALMLSHAGSSIFITSLTDVVAFVIGASTILPSLQSFCIYAAVGVFVTFLLQVTFFVGFFTLDTQRVEAKRNGIVPCIVHEDHQPVPFDEERLSWRLTEFLYSHVVLTKWGKIIALIITAGVAVVGILGSTRLEQRFDPEWFLPEDTYLAQYLAESRHYYPSQGHEGYVFMREIDHVSNFDEILTLSRKLKGMKIFQDVDQWPLDFARFVKGNYNQDASTLTTASFRDYLSQFLLSQSGGRYQKNFRFQGNLTCGEPAPAIVISSLEFTFAQFSSPHEWLGAMNQAKRVCADSHINGTVTVWSKVFASWVTDEVISDEVTRNLILALICVMGTTAVLVAELQTCLWIFTCVLLTLVDVCGLMYFWGLTVDIVSCIGLELAVGLSVDYAAHVAHAFLNSRVPDNGRDRTPRALGAVKHIGAAVVYGAGSTLLALSLLATSEAYVFRSFFKIFVLVVVFGLWHGLIFLPVVLSTVGPRALTDEDEKSKLPENVIGLTLPLHKVSEEE